MTWPRPFGFHQWYWVRTKVPDFFSFCFLYNRSLAGDLLWRNFSILQPFPLSGFGPTLLKSVLLVQIQLESTKIDSLLSFLEKPEVANDRISLSILPIYELKPPFNTDDYQDVYCRLRSLVVIGQNPLARNPTMLSTEDRGFFESWTVAARWLCGETGYRCELSGVHNSHVCNHTTIKSIMSTFCSHDSGHHLSGLNPDFLCQQYRQKGSWARDLGCPLIARQDMRHPSEMMRDRLEFLRELPVYRGCW
jgi:hypothetical protein